MAQLSGKLELLVYNDAQASNNPQERVQDSKFVLSDTSIAQWESKLLTIADGAVDQAIAFDSIASEYLMILSDKEISIKLNGSADAITLAADFPFLMKGSVSSLSISNGSGEDAQVAISIGK